MKPIIIGILAAPGVGKTFLSGKLSKKLNAKLLTEPPINNRILENFKESKRELETIIYFLNKGIENIQKAIKLKNENNIVIMDTCWVSTILHIKTMLKDFEKEIILEQSKFLEQYIPKPDILIYLTTSKKHIEKNIFERGNDFDTNKQFLKRIFSIRDEHEEYFKNNNQHIIINREKLDFTKDEDLNLIISRITEQLK